MLNTMAWAHREDRQKDEQIQREKRGGRGETHQNDSDQMRRSTLCSNIDHKKRESTEDSITGALTGGLVAAFRDSISAWVIHTLLVDCNDVSTEKFILCCLGKEKSLQISFYAWSNRGNRFERFSHKCHQSTDQSGKLLSHCNGEEQY